jgi:AraC-like DNA-binding protein
MPGGRDFDHVSCSQMRICVVHLPSTVISELIPAWRAETIIVHDHRMSGHLRTLMNSRAWRGSDQVAETKLTAELCTSAREFVLAHGPLLNHRYSNRAIYGKALALIDAHLDQPIRIPDLCSHLGVSRRTLENIFRAYLGHGPAKHIRLSRLNAVRRAIVSGLEAQHSVGDIASRVGIWHLGRLTEDFHQLFGQRPGELKRIVRDRVPSESCSGSADPRSEAGWSKHDYRLED